MNEKEKFPLWIRIPVWVCLFIIFTAICKIVNSFLDFWTWNPNNPGGALQTRALIAQGLEWSVKHPLGVIGILIIILSALWAMGGKKQERFSAYH